MIGAGGLMGIEHPIFAEISALLERRDGDAPLAELEHTLTAGYAAALELEAERWRIERRIADAAIGADVGEGKVQEIARLASRLTTTDADLSRLRGLLSSLRERSRAA